MKKVIAMLRYRKNEAGTAAVEFAIIAPLFLLLIFGLIAFGLYLGAAHSVQQLASSAARASIAGLDNAERTRFAHAYIEDNADQYPLIDLQHITVSAESVENGAAAYAVTVKYDAQHLPVWDLFAPVLGLPTTIETQSIIRDGAT